MSWILLFTAGLFETAFAFCLGKARLTSGTTAMYWYFGFVICLVISMVLLMKATRDLPIGTAYAVWTGIGAAGTALLGIFYFNEPAGMLRILFLILLIAGIVGLKFTAR